MTTDRLSVLGFRGMVAAAGLVLIWAGATACARGRAVVLSLPAPQQSTVVGPGDLFDVTVLGEKELEKYLVTKSRKCTGSRA